MAFYPPNSGGGGGGGPITGLTGTPTEVVYIDNAGNGTGDSLFTRDSVTNDSYLGQEQSGGVDRAAFELNTNILGAGIEGVIISRSDIAGVEGQTVFGVVDTTPVGGSSRFSIVGQAIDLATGTTANLNVASDGVSTQITDGAGISSGFEATLSDLTIRYQDAATARVNLTPTEGRFEFDDSTNIATISVEATKVEELFYNTNATSRIRLQQVGVGLYHKNEITFQKSLLFMDGNKASMAYQLNDGVSPLHEMLVGTNGFEYSYGGAKKAVFDPATGNYQVGDITGTGNSVLFTLQDTGQYITGSVPDGAGKIYSFDITSVSAALKMTDTLLGVDSQFIAGSAGVATDVTFSDLNANISSLLRMNATSNILYFNDIGNNRTTSVETSSSSVVLKYAPSIGDTTNVTLLDERLYYTFGADVFFDINSNAGIYGIGDIDGAVSTTYYEVDATNSAIMEYVDTSNRRVVAPAKTLSNNTTTDMFEIALPAGAMTGGTFTATVIATDGTDLQAQSDVITYAAVNKAGVYTTQITNDPAHDATAQSAGTITVSYTMTTGTDKVIIRVNANSSLTTTDIKIYFQIDNNDGHVVTLL